MPKNPQLTTTAGNPIADNQNSKSAGPRGPLLLEDYQLIEKLAHQNRERIPERAVHAKGSGAFGTLTITHDITRYTKAAVFAEVGKTTDVLLRFSTVAGERGAADAELPGADRRLGHGGAGGDLRGLRAGVPARRGRRNRAALEPLFVEHDLPTSY